ncbi:MAG: sulfatase-like hydrolase/transferase [Kiritimatiellae bacterium]|nr:sulfatase-like hydrolase/transferase [Kiritimatiellia bacterium]
MKNKGWAWLVVVLAGLFPFASDMFRNFQLFTPEQLAWSFATVLAGTSGVFFATWGGVGLAERMGHRLGKPTGAWLANGFFALAAAVVFAAFLYDSNMTELHQSFGLSRIWKASVVVALGAAYWAVAARLGPKRTCALLGALLVFRAGQAAWQIYGSATRGDALTGEREIQIYQGVKFARTPNVYLLFLESYHGFGTMEEQMGFDNGAFRKFLDDERFVVAKETYANYWYTMASIQSFLQMGHHYAAGMFGHDDSLYARGFVSGSGKYYNPVLNIFKQNGYSIVYLLPSDYYYRPGAGLVDLSLLSRSWPLAPLKVSLPRLIGREPDTVVPDYERQVARAIAEWPAGKPAFFFAKLGAEHAQRPYYYQTYRKAFVQRYVKSIQQSNQEVESLCRQIIARDPGAIVVLAGDHGPHSYKDTRREFLDVMREDGLPAEQMAKDVHDVLLAIRWGDDMEPEPYPFRSLANVMRYVFYRLSGDKALMNTAVADDSYIVQYNVLYQTVEDGHPLAKWQVATEPSRKAQSPVGLSYGLTP